jgi:UDPglucose--hexose-1-phosphate uridylyltransferase
MAGKEIMRIDGNGGPEDSGWRVKVIAEKPPLFHIEGDFRKNAAGICDRMEAIGAHEVVVESPEHSARIENLDEDHVFDVLRAIRTRSQELGRDPRLKQVFPFRTGYPAGVEEDHPRWHIVSTPFVPNVIKAELKGARKYFSYKERCAFCDYLGEEIEGGARVICRDSEMVAVSPYAARYPYEIWVVPQRHCPDFGAAADRELRSLASALRRLTGAVGRLPGASGYLVSIHTAPFRVPKQGAWKTLSQDYHWHMEIKPRVGVLNGLKDTGGIHLNPVTPEEAARKLAGLC